MINDSYSKYLDIASHEIIMLLIYSNVNVTFSHMCYEVAISDSLMFLDLIILENFAIPIGNKLGYSWAS